MTLIPWYSYRYPLLKHSTTLYWRREITSNTPLGHAIQICVLMWLHSAESFVLWKFYSAGEIVPLGWTPVVLMTSWPFLVREHSHKCHTFNPTFGKALIAKICHYVIYSFCEHCIGASIWDIRVLVLLNQ